ncbi:MAG: argininosuccinate synthase [Dehalococcoidia bacterium]|nr:argininosuccinate synthase [Chloroflexota bacterium]
MAKETILLAFSGGLDTSVCVKWLQEKHDARVVTLTVDLGMVDLEEIRQRALQIGAVDALTVDGREDFVRDYVFPALKAGAIYEEQYPLATALGRPLIAKYLVEAARRVGAGAIAHGCTGKGNDQVRIDVSVGALAPDLKVIAPVREWGWNREEEIEYAKRNGIPIQERNSRFSTDENLWGRSIEAGELEDPWSEPPEDAFAWTNPISKTPEEPTYLEIAFERGLPLSLDGEEMRSVDLVEHLNGIAGQNGIGRIDHIENRLVGIKSREVYESPAGVVLHAAHKALEAMTLSKDQARMKQRVAQEYSDMVYNGLWFTAHRRDLDAYVESTQRHVTGSVRVRMHRGSCTVVGRRAPRGLYSHQLATYDRGDTFDHRASEGFIAIYGLPVRTQTRTQGEGEEA